MRGYLCNKAVSGQKTVIRSESDLCAGIGESFEALKEHPKMKAPPRDEEFLELAAEQYNLLPLQESSHSPVVKGFG